MSSFEEFVKNGLAFFEKCKCDKCKIRIESYTELLQKYQDDGAKKQ